MALFLYLLLDNTFEQLKSIPSNVVQKSFMLVYLEDDEAGDLIGLCCAAGF